MSAVAFDGLKIFSAETLEEREHLFERVRIWIAAHPGQEICDVIACGSGHDAHRCISIALFCAVLPGEDASLIVPN